MSISQWSEKVTQDTTMLASCCAEKAGACDARVDATNAFGAIACEGLLGLPHYRGSLNDTN